jgi:hypothetical protein
VGTITDAVVRVVIVYALPADEVPALGTGLVLVTSVVLIVVTNVYYIASGVFGRSSRIHRAEPELTGAARRTTTDTHPTTPARGRTVHDES